MNNFLHFQINLFWYFDNVVNLNYLLSQNLNLSWNFNVLYCLRPWNFPYYFNFNWFLDFYLYNLRDYYFFSYRNFFGYYLRHFYNILNDFLGYYWLLNDKLNWYLLFERNNNLSVFDCNFMNLHYFFYDSVSKDFDWNLSDNLCWNSSFHLNLSRYLFLHNEFNRLLSFDNLNFFYILNDRPFNNHFFNYLYLFYSWHLSVYFNDL